MDHAAEKLREQPLVSILMLTYNSGRYIAAAIESVLAQSYQTWELTVIDDGSTDATRAIVARYPDTRIRYIRHESNEGIGVRRSESLAYAAGPYVAVLDSDDVWIDPEKLRKQVAFMQNHLDCAVIGSFIERIDERGAVVGTDTYGTTDTAIRNSILIRNQFAHSSTLMRTSVVKKTDGYRLTLAEDLDLFLQMGQYGTFANLPSFTTAYRVHASTTAHRRREMARAVHRILAVHREHYPRYPHALLVSYLRQLRAFLPTAKPTTTHFP